jgi:PPOX class probable F420-dependent enzyme
MRKMTEAEYKQFLMHGTRTAKVATVRLDGRPHVAPVWFVLDGDTLLFTTGANTVKGRDLRRDPRISLCVDDEMPPFAYVMIEGTATLSDDPDDLLRWATVIGGRYMGADRAEEYGRRNGVPGELLVRVTPGKIVALAEIAG